MRNNPIKQVWFRNRTVCEPPAELYQFVIAASKRTSVNIQKNHHGQDANAFVAVKKRVIFYEGKSKMRRHCFNGRIKILPAECMKRGIYGLIQQMGIPDAVHSAALCNKPAVPTDNYFLRNLFHFTYFASALKASMCFSIISSAAAIASSKESSSNSLVTGVP